MTTLDVHIGAAADGGGAYPMVKDLHVSTQFPHGMRIGVIEQLPVAALVAGGQTIAAAGDGTRASRRPDGLAADGPAALASRRVARHRRDRAQRARAARGDAARGSWRRSARSTTSAAARPRRPAPLAARRSTSATTPSLRAKWVAATAVLAAPTSAGADLHRRDAIPGTPRRRRQLGGVWPRLDLTTRSSASADDRPTRRARRRSRAKPQPRLREANPRVELEARKSATL